jgi:hypothetical protein
VGLRERVFSSGGGGSLAGDERLEYLAPLGGLGSLGLDVGVGEAGGGGDEGGAGEEEAGRGGALPPGRRVLQPSNATRTDIFYRILLTESAGEQLIGSHHLKSRVVRKFSQPSASTHVRKFCP